MNEDDMKKINIVTVHVMQYRVLILYVWLLWSNWEAVNTHTHLRLNVGYE